MNNNFKNISKAINASIDSYQSFIESLSQKKEKPKANKELEKIREFLFKKVL